MFSKITKKFSKKPTREVRSPPWEEEFKLYPAGLYLLTTEFMEMSTTEGNAVGFFNVGGFSCAVWLCDVLRSGISSGSSLCTNQQCNGASTRRVQTGHKVQKTSTEEGVRDWSLERHTRSDHPFEHSH